ncbi:MAG: hypothetical protein H7287_03120 [Thermoleophilia bacterium]|nr:hypothetical protein [Thermoleophilia bacterium]
MKRRLSLLLALAATLMASAVAVVGAADATTTPTQPAATVPSTTVSAPSSDDRRLERELDDVASAWAAAGGTYGYPFWDRARQRWHSGEISASLFREYVSGYRDRIHLGCELVDRVVTSSGAADDTHELVSHACSERVKGLTAQQKWLDRLIDKPVAGPEDSAEDVAASATRRDEQLSQLEADAQEHLQRSFRDARRAMNLAQGELDAAGLERLREDAFI